METENNNYFRPLLSGVVVHVGKKYENEILFQNQCLNIKVLNILQNKCK